jgi:hypothetical protein
MVKTITVQREGLPIDINVRGVGNESQLVHLFFDGSIDNLVELQEKSQNFAKGFDELQVKYPNLTKTGAEVSDQEATSVAKDVIGIMQRAYDLAFGPGTYDRLRGAGAGLLGLIETYQPLLSVIQDYVNKMVQDASKRSQGEAQRIVSLQKNRQQRRNRRH